MEVEEEEKKRELIRMQESGENRVRKVLRLRGEATSALQEFLTAEEEGRGELRAKLVEWGARMPGGGGGVASRSLPAVSAGLARKVE